MVEEIRNNLYRIEVPLKGNPLRALNSYFIRGDESDLLIDTGFRTDDCLNALREGLLELHYDPGRMDVLLTHFHADHAGLCDVICGPGRHVYMQSGEYAYEVNNSIDDLLKNLTDLFLSEGYSDDSIFKRGNAEYGKADYSKDIFIRYDEGDVIRVGEFELEPVHVPGHTPNNSMIYDRKHKIMFTGDHVLFGITPNIGIFPGADDSLGDYLESLDKAEKYDVDLALPGHRETGDYKKRIGELKEHHARRLAEVERLIGENPLCTTYETASRMKWRINAKSWEEFPTTQKWFAMGEALSHVRHLLKLGKIERIIREDGIRVYKAKG